MQSGDVVEYQGITVAKCYGHQVIIHHILSSVNAMLWKVFTLTHGSQRSH